MEKELIGLVKDILNMDEIHQEYHDNDVNCVLDLVKKDENTIVLTVSLKENEDKKEFEKWANDMDDDFFNEIWESLSSKYELKKLNDEYNSGNSKKVIDLFKEEAKELAKRKIDYLKSILGE